MTRHSKHFFSQEAVWIIVLGIAFHTIYLFSIIDIYFRSPIIQGIEPQIPTQKPLAKRLVLFVGTHQTE
jgi:phosphatidylinositol glycan class N